MTEANVIEAPPEPSIAELRTMMAGEQPAPAKTEEPKPITPKAPAETPKKAEDVLASPAEPKPPEADQEPAEKKAQEETPPRKPTGLEKEISRLTRKRREAEARAEVAEAALVEAQKPKPVTAELPPPVAASKPVPPKFEELPYEEQEPARLAYTEQLATWIADQKTAQLKAELQRDQVMTAAQRAGMELHTVWTGKKDKAVAENPEVQEAVDAIGPLVTRLGMADFIKESEVGIEVVMYLYEHPNEAERIGKLPNPLTVARELGKIEAKVAKAEAKPATAPAVPEKLPKPPATPGGSGTVSEPKLEDIPMEGGAFKRKVQSLLHK